MHHFIANSPWSVEELRTRRLNLTRRVLKDQEINLVIDETGDRKKGKKTEYVARQYLGSVGKVDKGIVFVNAYGVYENITFPLMFKVFKPKGTLKENDTYKTKIELASSIVTELVEFGFKIKLVLADSLLGWTHYRFTNFQEIEKWWEIIFSAYWMVSSHSKVLCDLSLIQESVTDFCLHLQWSNQGGWKTTLNNLRLIIQPTVIFWMIIPWLDVFPNRSFSTWFS